MTLQEFYDKAIQKGATPNSRVVIEYCNVNDMRVVGKGDNAIIFID